MALQFCICRQWQLLNIQKSIRTKSSTFNIDTLIVPWLQSARCTALHLNRGGASIEATADCLQMKPLSLHSGLQHLHRDFALVVHEPCRHLCPPNYPLSGEGLIMSIQFVHPEWLLGQPASRLGPLGGYAAVMRAQIAGCTLADASPEAEGTACPAAVPLPCATIHSKYAFVTSRNFDSSPRDAPL